MYLTKLLIDSEKKKGGANSPLCGQLCVKLIIKHGFISQSCSETEGVFEDGCFGKAYVLVPAFRHRRIVVVCRPRLLGFANSLLWAVSLVKNHTQTFLTSLRGTFRRSPSARRWSFSLIPHDALPCIRVAPSSPLSCFGCPLAEWCFRAIVLLSKTTDHKPKLDCEKARPFCRISMRPVFCQRPCREIPDFLRLRQPFAF